MPRLNDERRERHDRPHQTHHPCGSLGHEISGRLCGPVSSLGQDFEMLKKHKTPRYYPIEIFLRALLYRTW